MKILILLVTALCTVTSWSNPPEEETKNKELTDITINSPMPYFEEEAGYQGDDFENLSKKRKRFFSKDSGSQTKALNSLIDELSDLGGGEITIKKGKYELRQVNIKSNIHIYIEPETIIKLDKNIRGKGFPFALGVLKGSPLVENVRIIGLGTPETRPQFVLEKNGRSFVRAINFGHAKNVLVENFTIKDDLTGGTAIAFNPLAISDDEVYIPENITIANVKMTGASIGYGLVQTNAGRNILFRNLECEGGMTCRIEAHTGRKYDLGVYNIVIKNVLNKNGKAAVLLQPHSVVNGRVLVDGARSEGSTWTLFLKNGFVAKESKRRKKGTFSADSSFKNISMLAKDETATLSFKNYKYVPERLKPLYHEPNFVPVKKDHNHAIDNKTGLFARESAIKGPSIAVIYKDAKYPIQLPQKEALLLEGNTENRLKVLER